MDMLPFTDDIHKRSASLTTACLKSDSALVRSIAEFVIVGRLGQQAGTALEWRQRYGLLSSWWWRQYCVERRRRT